MRQGWVAATVIILSIITLSSCKKSTFYQPYAGSYGYSDTRIDSNTVRITYHGSYSTAPETVENYLLYRCAQVTLNHGYDYFVIISSSNRPVVSSYTSPSIINTFNKKGDQGYGYITPGQTTYFQKSIISNVIKMYKGDKPQQFANAYNARDVVNHLSKSIRVR